MWKQRSWVWVLVILEVPQGTAVSPLSMGRSFKFVSADFFDLSLICHGMSGIFFRYIQ